jgi:hypothetical protein
MYRTGAPHHPPSTGEIFLSTGIFQYTIRKGRYSSQTCPAQEPGAYMDFAEMLGDALTYTKEGVWGNMNRWLKLILAVLCLGLPFNGYVMRVYRGATPAPDVDQWGTLFVDGLKLLAVGIVYALPIVILWMLVFGTMLLAGFSDAGETAIAATGMHMLFMMLMYIVEIAIAIIMPVASIRFARTGTFAEAFNFSAVFETIGKIGWLNYIIAIVLVSLVVGIPVFVVIFGLLFGLIIIGGASLFLLKGAGVFIFLGLLLLMVLFILVLAPLVGVFQARYMTRVYDSAAPAVPES